MSLYRSLYESPIGTLSILSDGQSLCNIGIPFINIKDYDSNEDEFEIFAETKRWFDIYFSGKQPDFTPQIELYGTEFQKKVWKELMSIPFGQTATYGEIARRVGCRSAQAVGQVIGQNPILIIIPCHRIIAANGKLGGYSVGKERKMWLLNNEKIVLG